MWVNARLPTLIVCLSHKFRSENETQSKKKDFSKKFHVVKTLNPDHFLFI